MCRGLILFVVGGKIVNKRMFDNTLVFRAIRTLKET